MQRLNKATAWSAALLLLASLPVGAAPKSSPRALALRIGAMQRSYVEYVPLRLETPTAAVVIVLHGLGGSGEQVIEQGHWTSEADANGFIVVAPDGSTEHADQSAHFLGNPRSWNSGPQSGSSAERRGVDDVAFIRGVLADVRARHPVDARRVYVTGFSNGAAMAFRAAAEMSDSIAAVAPVANALLAARMPSTPHI